MGLAIAALVKQIPKFEAMELGAGRPPRPRRPRARDEPVLPARGRAGGGARAATTAAPCTVITLGPPERRGRAARGDRVGARPRRRHRRASCVTDPAFAGSDTLATATRARRRDPRARVRSTSCSPAATRSTPTPVRSGPSSPSCSTCRSPPASATSRSTTRTLDLRCEHDDGWVQARVELPAIALHRRAPHRPVQGGSRRPRRGRRPGDPHARRAPTSAPARGVRPRARRGSVGCGCSSPSGCATSCPTRRSTEQVRRAVEILTARGALDPALDHAGDLGVVPGARPARRPGPSACSSSRTDPRSPASCSGAAAALGGARRRARSRPTVDAGGARAAGARTRSCAPRLRAGGAIAEEDVAAGVHRRWVREPSPGPSSPRARCGVARSRAAPPPRSAPGSPVTPSGSSSTTTGSSPGSRRSAVSSSPRSTPTRRRRWRPCAPGMLAELHPAAPRCDATERRDRAAQSRRTCSPAPATTTSTCSPRRTRRHRRRPGRRRRTSTPLLEPLRDGARCRARRDPQGDRPGLAPPGPPGRDHRPEHRAAPLRRRSARAASSTTWSGCGPRVRSSRSTRTRMPSSSSVADVGIVGDWREVLPLLLAEIGSASPTR